MPDEDGLQLIRHIRRTESAVPAARGGSDGAGAKRGPARCPGRGLSGPRHQAGRSLRAGGDRRVAGAETAEGARSMRDGRVLDRAGGRRRRRRSVHLRSPSRTLHSDRRRRSRNPRSSDRGVDRRRLPRRGLRQRTRRLEPSPLPPRHLRHPARPDAPDHGAAQFRAAQMRDRSLAWIPVIVMSGAVDAARDAERIGARALVRKPVDLDQLRATLRQVGCLRTRLHFEERRSVD